MLQYYSGSVHIFVNGTLGTLNHVWAHSYHTSQTNQILQVNRARTQYSLPTNTTALVCKHNDTTFPFTKKHLDNFTSVYCVLAGDMFSILHLHT